MLKTTAFLLHMVCILAVSLHAAKPNVIFIITDDHGYNDLEATDLRGEVDMPNVDRLSNGGALLTQAYCTAPQCVPSRAGIVIGRYQQKFGMDRNEAGPLPKDQKSIASRLKEQGYTTGHVGKWHLDPNHKSKKWLSENGYQSFAKVPGRVIASYKPGGFGYDEFAEGTGSKYWSNFDLNGPLAKPAMINYAQYENSAHKNKFRIELQTELALGFIERNVDSVDPFFLYLAYYGPHSPMNAPASLTDQVLSIPELQAKGYDHSKYTYKKSGQYARDYTEAEVRQQGLALLKGIDNGVGELLDLLEAKGELENTIIFFIGDNGAPAGNKSWDGSMNDPWHGSKGIIFEGGARIPYIVYWPGVVEPQVFDRGVSTLDAGATAVALAGSDPAEDPLLDGVNLIPFLTGKASGEPHRYLYQRFLNTASVVQGKYKFMRHDNGEELLFDVSMETPGAYNPDQDFHEAVNLIDSMPEKAGELSKELERWLNELPASPYEGGWHDSLYQFIKQRWGFKK